MGTAVPQPLPPSSARPGFCVWASRHTRTVAVLRLDNSDPIYVRTFHFLLPPASSSGPCSALAKPDANLHPVTTGRIRPSIFQFTSSKFSMIPPLKIISRQRRGLATLALWSISQSSLLGLSTPLSRPERSPTKRGACLLSALRQLFVAPTILTISAKLVHRHLTKQEVYNILALLGARAPSGGTQTRGPRDNGGRAIRRQQARVQQKQTKESTALGLWVLHGSEANRGFKLSGLRERSYYSPSYRL